MRKLRKDTDSFIEEANKRHDNKYDYSLVEYNGCNKEIVIRCKIHGEFTKIAYQHLYGVGCPQCSKELLGTYKFNNSKKGFKIRASEIHSSYYNYDKVDYKGAKEFVTITCPVHGDFEQRPNYHLSGNGCYKCYKDRSGFGKKRFLEACKGRKGRLYLIECYNDNEKFYKIGITSKTIKIRFKSNSKLKYDYNIIYELEGDPERVFLLEKELHKKYKDLKYKPLIEFKGNTECFKLTKEIVENDFRGNEESS